MASLKGQSASYTPRQTCTCWQQLHETQTSTGVYALSFFPSFDYNRKIGTSPNFFVYGRHFFLTLQAQNTFILSELDAGSSFHSTTRSPRASFSYAVFRTAMGRSYYAPGGSCDIISSISDLISEATLT
jgi:hypothetical protein